MPHKKTTETELSAPKECSAAKFMITLPADVAEKIKRMALAHYRSRHSEVVFALTQHASSAETVVDTLEEIKKKVDWIAQKLN